MAIDTVTSTGASESAARCVEPAEPSADDDDVARVALHCSYAVPMLSYRHGAISENTALSRDGALGGPASVVETACPLDCPDACSLDVTVRHGKVISIDGSARNPVTQDYICAKVRKFGERVYGADRLLYPAVRSGRKGEGRFKRISWDEALELVVDRMRAAKPAAGRRVDPAVLLRRIERADDAGQPRRHVMAPLRHVAAGANASAPRQPAPPTRRCTARCHRSPTRTTRTRS